ncbi:MAG: WYL domain-containing protein [Planctomycetaceae bacterium]
MSASKSLIRQWRLLKLLADAHTGYTVKELSAEMEVSLETIRRDISDLTTGGFRVCESVGFRGVKRWRVEGFREAFGFTITDLLSIYMGRQFLEPLAGTPFWDGQHKVFSKIRGALGEQALRYLQKLAASLHTTAVGSSDYSKRWKMIDQLIIAVEDRLVSLIVYQSDQATEPVEQEVYPQGFVFHRGSLYLIAWSSRRSEIRTYKMDRIDDVHSTNLKASIPRNSIWPTGWNTASSLPKRQRPAANHTHPFCSRCRPLRQRIPLAQKPETEPTKGRQPDRRIPSDRHPGD